MLDHYITKMTGPLETWIIHLSFYTFIQLYRVYILFFTATTHIPTRNVFLPKSNQILQYGNILQYTQTQYAIWHWPILFHPYKVV